MTEQTKVALCVKGHDPEQLTNNDAVIAEFVTRAICEDPANEWLQIIPYGGIWCFDNEDNVHVLTYTRAKGGTEDRLHDLKSVGFGGHIDSADDVQGELTEDGKRKMTQTDLINTALRTLCREIEEELGIQIADNDNFQIDGSKIYVHYDPTDDVNKVHAGINFIIQTTPDQMKEILDSGKESEREIKGLELTKINVKDLALAFDNTIVIKKLKEEVKAMGFEAWSVNLISNIAFSVVEYIQNHIRKSVMAQPEETTVEAEQPAEQA